MTPLQHQCTLNISLQILFTIVGPTQKIVHADIEKNKVETHYLLKIRLEQQWKVIFKYERENKYYIVDYG